jgi:hypothetical protein
MPREWKVENGLIFSPGSTGRSKAAATRVVDLRRTITDYGYDPEAAAADHSCGLEYVSEADRTETDYHINVGSVSGLSNTKACGSQAWPTSE